MTYSLEQLLTVEDCTSLLEVAQKEKETLLFRQTSLLRQIESYKERSVETISELQIVNAEVAALEGLINSLPEGTTKEENTTKLKKLQLKQFLLNDRTRDYGAVALLDKEFDLGRIKRELEEADTFIAAVEERKTLV